MLDPGVSLQAAKRTSIVGYNYAPACLLQCCSTDQNRPETKEDYAHAAGLQPPAFATQKLQDRHKSLARTVGPRLGGALGSFPLLSGTGSTEKLHHTRLITGAAPCHFKTLLESLRARRMRFPSAKSQVLTDFAL